MTGPDRYRLLATFVAGRAMEVAEAPAGRRAYSDGRIVFVSAGAPDGQRREVMLQSALVGAGSLDRALVKNLRGRPRLARRYLALEGHRALARLAPRLPLAAALCPDEAASTSSASESLEFARGRRRLAEPPDWFGAIRPATLLSAAVGPGAPGRDADLRLHVDTDDARQPDDEDESSEESRILKLFEAPIVTSRALSDFLRRLLGSSRSSDHDAPGGELQVGSVRRGTVGPNARPLPTPIRFTDDGRPVSVLGTSAALHPEWDVFHGRYRKDWCRVVECPVPASGDVATDRAPRDDVLRRRLSRLGLGPKTLRRRSDGDELDVEALIELSIDLWSGHSPPEHVYLETRALARNLGVLILLDSSGSATDTDPDGLAVHEHQRRAAETLTSTLAELGDRVAVYGFRSHGRHDVQLLAIKAFGHRFGAAERTRLHRLRPGGYTRLGAGIRGAGELLKAGAGTPNRLLLVLSDGFPYDDGYEGRYAEADAARALEELRADGVACLCLSIGAATTTETLERVFGSASHASAATLDELSPRMDELFLAALRELAVPRRER